MRAVLDAIESPLSEEETKQVRFDRSSPRFLDPDTEENLNKIFLENNWTDQLPIILPTEERVAKMLKGTSRSPDEVVGRMRPTKGREAWGIYRRESRG